MNMRGRREEALASHAPATHELGTTIRAWRHVRGLSVTELAVAAGFGKNGRGYISRVEHSQIRHLGEERLLHIAAALQLQSSDLLLHRMPEAYEETSAQNLDAAIIGGRALLETCSEKSLDWARLHLLLAKLYRERAATSCTVATKYADLTKAHQCIERSLDVFTAETAPKSFREAAQLRREIDDLLQTAVTAGCIAFLQRSAPHSFNAARIHILRARWYCELATTVQGVAARTALSEAQQCVEAALAILTHKPAQRSAHEARHLAEEIRQAMHQLDEQEIQKEASFEQEK